MCEEGGTGAILLIDRENGKAIGITLWSDEEAMRASEEKTRTGCEPKPRMRFTRQRRRESSATRSQCSNRSEGPQARTADRLGPGFGRGLVAEAHLVKDKLDAATQAHDVVMRESKRRGGRVLGSAEVKHLTLGARLDTLATT